MIFLGTIGWVIVFGRWRVNRTLATLTILSGIAILTGLIENHVKKVTILICRKRRVYHRLRSGSGVNVSARMVRSYWSHGAGMSRTDGATVAILVRERLEVHCLAGVHFLAETEQMEGCVGADFIFHACVEYRN